MYLGTTTFICRSCGHQFTGMATEYKASVFIAPCTCPQCGSKRTRPVSPLPDTLADKAYLNIWEQTI